MSEIVLENFNEGDGYYKVNLAYLNKEQVEEIEELVSKWKPIEESEDEMVRKLCKELIESSFINELCNKEERDACINWMEKQGEKKSADKVEPKFHEGDWIVNKTSNLVYRVESILLPQSKCYYLSHDGGIILVNFADEQNYRFWSIADAKDGDVLVTTFDEDNMIVMYHSMCTIDTINVHCCLDNKFVCWNLGVFDAKDVKPATNEQRAILFEKMHEAGYEWDTEKKTLRKIIQNPTDNIEPKFQEGNWIVNNDTKDIFLIKSINNGYCTLEDIKGNIISPCLPPCENESHIWTIKDAKEGDVLTDNLSCFDNPFIFILKRFENVYFGLPRPSDFSSHCFLTMSDKQEFREGDYHHMHNICPATKEQRDLLFQKMHGAGYKWDDESKQLLSLKAEPTREIRGNQGKISPKWTEEDESVLQGIWDEILANKHEAKEYDWNYDKYLDWLNSLKQRMKEC